MVWNFAESDSEEERHDRFRSERTTLPENTQNLRLASRELGGRGGGLGASGSSWSRGGRGERKQSSPNRLVNREPRGICALCDYRIDVCHCRPRSPGEADRLTETSRRDESGDVHSRKRRHSKEDHRSSKHKSADTGRSRENDEKKAEVKKSERDKEWIEDEELELERKALIKQVQLAQERKARIKQAELEQEMKARIQQGQQDRKTIVKPIDLEQERKERIKQVELEQERKERIKQVELEQERKARNREAKMERAERKHKKKCKRKLKEKKKESSTRRKPPKQTDITTDHTDQTDNIISSDGLTDEGEASCDADNQTYGPVLPNSNPDNVRERERSDDETDMYGPRLPDTGAVEEDARKQSQQSRSDNGTGDSVSPTAQETAAYGPPLPPRKEPAQRSYGPSLPSTLMNNHSSGSEMKADNDDVHHNNSEPEQRLDSDDDIGPLPEGSALTPSQILLQHRATLLKVHMENKQSEKTKTQREEWMLELPDKLRTGIGLASASRSFKSRPAATLDPSWTDTPQDKAEKQLLAQMGTGKKKKEDDGLERQRKHRDSHMEQLASKCNKRSDKSLLKMHQDKIKQKKKESEKQGPAERRPFSRDTDLGISRLTQAQKQSIYKKAAALDSRFSSGKSKYL